MEYVKSKSEKRLIVEAVVNGRAANFLIDTGASVGLMDVELRKDFDLAVGRRYPGTIVGAGGEMKDIKYCNTFAYIGDKPISQFLLADIEPVVNSIKRETGIHILGIISLPQMKSAGISLDCNDNLIIIE